MRVLALFSIIYFLGSVFASPLAERATVQQNGVRVAVVTGLIMNQHLTQCFYNSGVEIAKAYAGAIADQWTNYNNANHGANFINGIEAQWSTSDTTNLYCSTFDAVFIFGSTYSARVFATWVQNLLGNTKRDELPSTSFNIGNLKPDVYIAGVDLPENHHYFGTNKTVPIKKALGKRTWGSCSNNKCGFSFTSDQTSICRDSTFPVGHQYTC
ncbi:hypothetical protein BC941DRAFT_519677 [Chlamydoabsidia padenii]|nr:hypothetical protein BC941DRAFT_519676 [Chlamydoabsidia padenii]KAI8327534.1 hypothetical protein BC941DRAFT_519677 [Chlamydoabsidia padenii]